LLLAFCGPFRWGSSAPGPLFRATRPFTFAHRPKRKPRGNCSVCNAAARGGVSTWVLTALQARPGPWQSALSPSRETSGLSGFFHF